MNLYRSFSGDGYHVELETMVAEIPISTMRLRYDIGKGMKVHAAFLGYDRNGNIFLRSKNQLPKLVKKVIGRMMIGDVKFINKVSEI